MKRFLLNSIIISGLAYSTMIAQSLNIKTGWNMIGAASNIDLYRFDNSCVEYVWKLNTLEAFGELGWQAYVADATYSYNGNAIKAINKNDGLWIKAKADCTISINDHSDITDNSSVITQTLYDIDEEDLVLTQLNPTKAGTTYKIVGGDDHYFFFLTTDGKIGFKESLYYSTPKDANGDNNYNIVIETTNGSETYRNNLNFTIAAQNDYKIVSNFYDKISIINDSLLDQNAMYTPKVVGGKIDKIDGNVTYTETDNSGSDPMGDMMMGPSEQATCSEDWSIQSYCKGMDNIQPKCVDNSALPSNAVSSSCGTGQWDNAAMKMVYTEDTSVSARCSTSEYNMDTMMTTFIYYDNMSAVCIPPTVNTVTQDLVLDQSGDYPSFSVKLPVDIARTYTVNINTYDGSKKATQTFEYETLNSSTPPRPQDFEVSVNKDTWTKIDFATKLSISDYYEYEIVKEPKTGYVVKKLDGTIWFYGNENDSFNYLIRYHNGDVTLSNNSATTEVKTVTVGVQ